MARSMYEVDARIENKHRLVSEVTPAVRRVFRLVEVGDSVKIEYESDKNGVELSVTGTVSEVNRLPDGRFDDLRLSVAGGECYLHFNPETGDYCFVDQYPEQYFHTLKSIEVRKA